MSSILSKLGETAEPFAVPALLSEEIHQEFQERTQESSFQAEQVIEASRTSLDFLCALAMPTIYEYAFPPVYLSVWQWLLEYVHKERDFSQLALGLPRGFSKTTLMKLFILYCILFTDRQFILVIGETGDKARNIIADIMDMLAEPNIVATFGNYKLGIEIDRQELKKFGFRGRNIVLAGLGSGGDPRGLNIKHRRPDVMLFDDVQGREIADSQVLSEQLERWMIGTTMKAKSPRGCLFLFVGNMYPTKFSILRKLKANPRWIKFIAGGILANGESLWEELQPIAQLLAEYENDLTAGHPEIFYAEVLNDENASVNNLVNFDALPALPFISGDIPAGNFIIIDPSSGKINSDDVAIGYFEVFESAPVGIEVRAGKFSPGETIRIALEIALTKNCRLIVCEGVAYQTTLNYWFKFVCEQTKIYGIEFVDIYPGGTSKNSRILGMFKALQKGEIFFADEVRPLFITEAASFNPLRRDNTDNILDLFTYAPRVIEQFGEFVVSNSVLIQQDNDAIEIIPEGYNSPF